MQDFFYIWRYVHMIAVADWLTDIMIDHNCILKIIYYVALVITFVQL